MPKTVILLLFCWFAIFGIIREVWLRQKHPWSCRRTFILATISMGTILTIITEILSLFHHFERDTLLMAWLVIAGSSGSVCSWLWYCRTGLVFTLPSLSHNYLMRISQKISWDIAVSVGLIFFQVVTLAMVAYRYTPNNWDSMTYHLARVVHWQQNQSVWHYATHIDRQIQMPPFSEFVIAHLQILTYGDWYANFVQWFAMVTCIIGVSEIARILGAKLRGQLSASLLCASIPMGILQATSTQNDYVVAAWIVCFVIFSLLLFTDTSNAIPMQSQCNPNAIPMQSQCNPNLLGRELIIKYHSMWLVQGYHLVWQYLLKQQRSFTLSRS